MKPDPSPSPTDLSVEQVRLLLAQQGYVIPEIELVEVTASVNALIEGLTHMEAYGTLENEPWPTLVGYVEMPKGATSPRSADAGATSAGGNDRAR